MKVFSAIFAGIYGFVLAIRHWLFNVGILKSYKADIPVICVGNVTVGGTGKTPVIEYLLSQLECNYKVAVLSRGYGRKTKGYIEVTLSSSFLAVGDEPKQIKRKFPDSVIVVCEKRAEGIRRIREEHPEVKLILLDDGFQHRWVNPQVDIVLMDYTRPIWTDHLLPWGSLRDLPSELSRANIVIVTKTPVGITPIDRRLTVKNLKLFAYQSIFFTSMCQDAPQAMFPDVDGLVTPGRNVAVMAGIGNPAALISSLGSMFDIRAEWLFRDHYVYRMSDLKRVEAELQDLPQDLMILTTEKDAVKLTNKKKIPVELQRRLYKVPVRVCFDEGQDKVFIKTLNENIDMAAS